jgi:hypothetical protein
MAIKIQVEVFRVVTLCSVAVGKNIQCPLDRRLDSFQSRSGRGGEEKNYQPLSGIETVVHPAA